jgi:hydroxyacylglutathione hydrolase
MLLKRFYDENLAQASYLVGCSATGEALVIDPARDIDQYLDAADSEGVRITHVTETHIHADFVSGSRELADRTGAKLFLSDEGGLEWKYAFAGDAGATLLHDGDSFMVGNIRVEAMHTPGHTPEHIAFVITDTPATSEPMAVFTGDFVFVGDVGRPDLLEKAAGAKGTMRAAARQLFRSLQRFRELPDYMQLWPGHGAGSACGKALGAVPSTTLGYEKLANWGLRETDEETFVDSVLADQPEPPAYFAEMKRINKHGPRLLHGLKRPERLPASRIGELIASGAMIVDTRHASDFALGHLPGTVNIPLGKSFTTWAGWLVSYEKPFYLIVSEDAHHAVDEAVRDLAAIGLDHVGGYFGSDVLTAWSSAGSTLQTTPQLDVTQLGEEIRHDRAMVIDVRGRSEWDAGHIDGARHLPLGYLLDGVRDLPRETPIVVHCQSGARSAIAASLLQADGFDAVANVTGGFAAWVAAGHPVEKGVPADSAAAS